MVSEAVILAGGLGTRMLPASLYSAKEALPGLEHFAFNHEMLDRWAVDGWREPAAHNVESNGVYENNESRPQ